MPPTSYTPKRIKPLRNGRPSNDLLSKGVPERRYLPELHGVRGLALLGVVLFHLFGNGRTSGGIDIFLAVTGFLFTGMLLREASISGGRIDPWHYLGRLLRRIVVPAGLVVIVTLAAGLLISPVTEHDQLWAEAIASLLYVENFELINSQLAYGAAGPETSPFQHFWSLSVQGQFYLLWPVVTVAAVFIARKLRRSAAMVMGVFIGAIFVSSLIYAMYVGSFSQDEAYLMTTTRAWELAFGGLLALLSGSLRLPSQYRLLAGWSGILLILTCGFVLDGAHLFPGPWALWPLIGLTLVLISAGPEGGNHDPKNSAAYFLSNRTLGWIGDLAYGLYLWHWPLLIFYMDVRGRDAIGIRGALIVLTITVCLAITMHRCVELPLQRLTRGIATHDRRRAANKLTVATGVATIMPIAVLGATPTLTSPTLEADEYSLDESLYPGAAQYFSNDHVPDADSFPPLERINEYYPDYVMRDCVQQHGNGPGKDEIEVCSDENAPREPTATIVLAGGSHSGHLEGAFKTLGQEYGWEVLVVTKSRCDFGIEDVLEDSWCDRWSANLISWLTENPVDLVVTPGTRLDREEYILKSAPEWWEKITDTGSQLMLVRGMPRGDDVPHCLALGGSSQECGITKENFAETNPLHEVALPDNVATVDVAPYVCPTLYDDEAENCEAIVGNIIVSYDGNHLTSVFSRSLAPAFEAEMKEILPVLFS